MVAEELTQEQVDEFYDKGFLIIPDFWNQEEVKTLVDAFERLKGVAEKVKRERLGGLQDTANHDNSPLEEALYEGSQFRFVKSDKLMIRNILSCGGAEKVLDDYSKNPKLLKYVSQILGTKKMNQVVNNAHFKFPGDNVAFPWHQDSQFRGYGTPEYIDVNGKGSFVQTMTAVDPQTLMNGPLFVIPGSHKLGHLGINKIPKEEQGKYFNEKEAIPLLMKPGDLALTHLLLIHGSDVSKSDTEPRRLFINGYVCHGANTKEYPGTITSRLLEVA